MATNQFKPFATRPDANVTPQNEWENLPALLSGFAGGKASSAQVNKALRQTSFIAAALAQFVSDKSGQDVLDDGDIAAFLAKLTSGFGNQYLSRQNPFADIKADGAGAVSTALANLGLGNAKFVTNQGSNVNGDWTIWSDGTIELNGYRSTIVDGLATVIFPITLPKLAVNISIAEHLNTDLGSSVEQLHVSMVIDDTITTSGFKARCQTINGGPSGYGFSWRVYCSSN
ncbi:hypothetical protein F3J29_00230 [Enterobacter sp. Cy-643]|uniref:hypothetical protein n=1 Tax=Enterobacter sp. Cy-643 TaxID=2608346 RepID=UPI00142023C4|nr:hypothetical protein [Enterobacter sp. Cy-643]NIF30569.1 hypothetical protein [Enterobacter sp. Cy-643]